jgi:hypothetical protein
VVWTLAAGGVERRGVQSARRVSTRVVGGGSTARAANVYSARGGSARAGNARGGVSSKGAGGGGGGGGGEDEKRDDEIEKNGSDEAILDAFIKRLGKVPGCHGDYCNTLSVKELINLREDHQTAVGLSLPGVILVTWTILAVVNWCLRPYALLGLSLPGVILVTWNILAVINTN